MAPKTSNLLQRLIWECWLLEWWELGIRTSCLSLPLLNSCFCLRKNRKLVVWNYLRMELHLRDQGSFVSRSGLFHLFHTACMLYLHGNFIADCSAVLGRCGFGGFFLFFCGVVACFVVLLFPSATAMKHYLAKRFPIKA